MMCDWGVIETQEHFLMECDGLRSLRERHGVEGCYCSRKRLKKNNMKKKISD